MRLTSGIDVYLTQSVGSDRMICDCATASTGRDITAEREAGLINYLMRNRHGSPFEHGSMTFHLKVPVKVWWEHVRHRIGWSYSLWSSRWDKANEANIEIFTPVTARLQTGKGSNVKIEDAPHLTRLMTIELGHAAQCAMISYFKMIDAGIAPEVASYALPMNLMWSGYATCNPRSLMNFLALRVKDPEAAYPSNPLLEINRVADRYEHYFAQMWPATYAAFLAGGRVAP